MLSEAAAAASTSGLSLEGLDDVEDFPWVSFFTLIFFFFLVYLFDRYSLSSNAGLIGAFCRFKSLFLATCMTFVMYDCVLP